MSYTFKEIIKEIEKRNGSWAADEYRQAIEKDGHSEYERVYSSYQVADGAAYPGAYHGREAYRSLERKREEREREREDEF